MPSSSTSISSSGLVISSTTFNQTRYAGQKNGVSGFYVGSAVTTRGLLPDTAVFLVRIQDPANTSLDEFDKVVSAADFDAYPTTRDGAVLNGGYYYRASATSVFYTDILDARNGATTIKEEVDALVKDWVTYTYSFNYGPPGDYVFMPTSDRAALGSLVSIWQTARAATLTAATEVDAAQERLLVASNAVVEVEADIATATSLRQTIDQFKQQSDALRDVITHLENVSARFGVEPLPVVPPQNVDVGSGFWLRLNNLLYVIQDRFDSIDPSIHLEMAAVKNAMDVFAVQGIADLEYMQDQLANHALAKARSKYVDLSVKVAEAAALLSTLATTQANVNVARQKALRDQLTAQTTYDAAMATEARALGAVRNADPAFDPNNPNAVLV